MNTSIRLGRFAGVDVGLHWSVVGIVALLVVGLATGLLPTVFPGYSTATYALTALGIAVLFLASLLAHELAHAVVAIRDGVQVEGITLWLLGGVARLRGEAKTPGADARIAGVGPLTSLVLGGVFAVLAAVLRQTGADPLLTGSAGYLALINGILAVFNLIPAAPLDGGRLLRATLWAARGDRYSAEIWSARAGRGFGFLLIALGVVELLTRSAAGLWWILIGMFVITIASAEEHQAEITNALGDLHVRDVMTADPETTQGNLTVEDFLHRVATVRPHSAYPLRSEDGALVTLNRLRRVPVQLRSTTTLREIACPRSEVPTARPDEALSELLPRMRGSSDGRALVFDGGELVGIVSPSDISRVVMWREFARGGRSGTDVTGVPRSRTGI
jgi:Zn-dependent protease